MHGPLEDLKGEHRLIERVLSVLERASRGLRIGEETSPDTIEEALQFVRGFADGCHHAKEEQGLFPLLASKGRTLEAGPVHILSEEHDAGRTLMGDLEEAVEEMRAGRPRARERARFAIDTYARMLRRHIAKEEEVLFRIAEGLITTQEAAALQGRFAEVEGRTGPHAHRRYEAKVREMEAASGIAGKA